MRPVDEYRKATEPWVVCSRCGTKRPQDSQVEGRCKDTVWCEAQRPEMPDAAMGWPRDYPRLSRVEGLEVVRADLDPWGES